MIQLRLLNGTMKLFISVGVILSTFHPSVHALDAVVLSERVLKLSLAAAELSSLAYEKNPPGDAYQHFGYFDTEPDQALIAQKNGYCYAAFRGTTMTWDDWKQYVFFLRKHKIHRTPLTS
jgi:hypothetical protein